MKQTRRKRRALQRQLAGSGKQATPPTNKPIILVVTIKPIPTPEELNRWQEECDSRVKVLAFVVFAMAALFIAIVVWFSNR